MSVKQSFNSHADQRARVDQTIQIRKQKRMKSLQLRRTVCVDSAGLAGSSDLAGSAGLTGSANSDVQLDLTDLTQQCVAQLKLACQPSAPQWADAWKQLARLSSTAQSRALLVKLVDNLAMLERLSQCLTMTLDQSLLNHQIVFFGNLAVSDDCCAKLVANQQVAEHTYQTSILDPLVVCMQHSSASLRKRASWCLYNIGCTDDDTVLAQLVRHKYCVDLVLTNIVYQLNQTTVSVGSAGSASQSYLSSFVDLLTLLSYQQLKLTGQRAELLRQLTQLAVAHKHVNLLCVLSGMYVLDNHEERSVSQMVVGLAGSQLEQLCSLPDGTMLVSKLCSQDNAMLDRLVSKALVEKCAAQLDQLDCAAVMYLVAASKHRRLLEKHIVMRIVDQLDCQAFNITRELLAVLHALCTCIASPDQKAQLFSWLVDLPAKLVGLLGKTELFATLECIDALCANQMPSCPDFCSMFVEANLLDKLEELLGQSDQNAKRQIIKIIAWFDESTSDSSESSDV
jgi:hypothetical protein